MCTLIYNNSKYYYHYSYAHLTNWYQQVFQIKTYRDEYVVGVGGWLICDINNLSIWVVARVVFSVLVTALCSFVIGFSTVRLSVRF